jgi:integrase
MTPSAKNPPWIYRWKNWIAPTPSKPGVWRRRQGGYLVRARAQDPRTRKLREVKRVLPTLDAAGAYAHLQEELRLIREGTPGSGRCKPRFCDYAVSLVERKLKTGEIKSAASRVQWANDLRVHLLPAFGLLYIDQIRRADVEAWRSQVAERILTKEYSPATANGWLDKLRVILNSAYIELELLRNPIAGFKPFGTATRPTYTEEQPNSLTASELQEFLCALREHHPQHFAMVALGFATGLRPSSLRPLRRQGPECDVFWEEGAILIRRSHTLKQEVMNTTKTGLRQKIALPAELMDILRWHVDRLPEGAMRDSELLFPGKQGGFLACSTLADVYRRLLSQLGMKKRITPRAMRRTFQDLARAAEVRDVVTRAVSGHATATMQHHYSTVSAEEMRHNLAKVVSLAGFQKALAHTGRGARAGAPYAPPPAAVSAAVAQIPAGQGRPRRPG